MRYKITFYQNDEVVLEAVCDERETLVDIADRGLAHTRWQRYYIHEWNVTPDKFCYWRCIAGPVLPAPVPYAAPVPAGARRTGKPEDAAGDEFEPM